MAKHPDLEVSCLCFITLGEKIGVIFFEGCEYSTWMGKNFSNDLLPNMLTKGRSGGWKCGGWVPPTR